MRSVGNKIQDLIEKVEKITSASYIATDELIDFVEFLESVDEENRVLLRLIKENCSTLDLLDVSKSLLKYYNVVESDLPLSEKKSKIFSVKGKLARASFDLFQCDIPHYIQETIEKLKKC